MLTDKEFLENFGTFLKNKRVHASLTQRDVADHMGYTTPQFISNWERGLIAPPLQTIRELIDLYGCSAKEVCDFIGDSQLRILKQELITHAKNSGKATKTRSKR